MELRLPVQGVVDRSIPLDIFLTAPRLVTDPFGGQEFLTDPVGAAVPRLSRPRARRRRSVHALSARATSIATGRGVHGVRGTSVPVATAVIGLRKCQTDVVWLPRSQAASDADSRRLALQSPMASERSVALRDRLYHRASAPTCVGQRHGVGAPVTSCGARSRRRREHYPDALRRAKERRSRGIILARDFWPDASPRWVKP